VAPIQLLEADDDDPIVVVTVGPVPTRPRAMDQVVVAVHTDGTDPGGEQWEVLVQGLSTLDPSGARAGGRSISSVARVSADLISGWRTCRG
jgi:hypothetical protein